MTKWKLVPVEPTEEMLTAALYAMEQPRMRVNDAKRDKINGLFVGLGAMLSAAPKASEDEALVDMGVKLLRTLGLSHVKYDGIYEPTAADARAFLKMLEGE